MAKHRTTTVEMRTILTHDDLTELESAIQRTNDPFNITVLGVRSPSL